MKKFKIMENKYEIAMIFDKLNDLKSYVNVLSIPLTGTGCELINSAQHFLNANIGDLEFYVKEYFAGDSEIIHEINMLSDYINHDVCNLKGNHEMRTDTARALITNQIVKIENLIKNRLAE